MTPTATAAGATAPAGPPAAEPVPYPTAVHPYRQGLAERLYLPLLGGLWVTLRHFLRNLFHPGSMYTIQYPEERREYSHRFRGHHILTTRPDGSVRCVACYLCAQACPAECIHIEAGEHPDVNIEKYPVVYEIDMLRCVFCGYCVDACPEEAIIMSNNYDMAYFNRDQTVVGKADLMKPYTFDDNLLGYRPRYPEEDAARARMRREAFSLVEATRRATAGRPLATEVPGNGTAPPESAGTVEAGGDRPAHQKRPRPHMVRNRPS
jgi:NADH-quinone oxidoreductase subunit I